MKIAGFYREKREKAAGTAGPLLLTVLLLASFAAGMLTHRAISRPPQPDAGLSYIEDIPVYTDFLPEGGRAAAGKNARSNTSSSTETDNFSAGATAAAHNSFIPPERRRAGEYRFTGITPWTTTKYTITCRTTKPRVPCGRPDERNGGNKNGVGIEMCVNEDATMSRR